MIEGTHLEHWIDNIKLKYMFGLVETKKKSTKKTKKKNIAKKT
jgi:hypothetical protein